MRGLKVLGAPIGSDEFVRAQLEVTATKHATLLQRIPALRDLQSAWLLLLFCAAPRANFHLRVVRPPLSEAFRKPTTTRCGRVFANWLGLPGGSESARRAAGVPSNLGGLGLCLAAGSVEAAHWASWADCIPNVKKRHRDAEVMVSNLMHHEGPSFTAVRECVHTLREAQFEVRTWEAVWAGLRPGQSEDDEYPVQPKHGWQKPVARATHEERVARTVWPTLALSGLWRSQKGPLACSAFMAFPTSWVNADRSTTVPGFVVSLQRRREMCFDKRHGEEP